MVEGRYLINFKLCYELAEQIDSITQYSPPDVRSEARQDVLEYVEYNLQSGSADNATMAGNGKPTDGRSIPKQQGPTRPVGKSRLPTQGRLDVVRRPDRHMAKWRGDMTQWREDMEQRREQDKVRRYEQDMARRRQEDLARRREEDMELWREDMARWREERARWGEDRTRRRDKEMAGRREEDMARWREDTARWLDDMARWREERARRHEREKAPWVGVDWDTDVRGWSQWGPGGDMSPRRDEVVQKKREEDKEPRREGKDSRPEQPEHSESVPRRGGFMSRLFDRKTAKKSS